MTATVESIWNEVANQLRSFIHSRVRDHGAAEDIFQEVFLKIHQKLPSVRASERLWPSTKLYYIDTSERPGVVQYDFAGLIIRVDSPAESGRSGPGINRDGLFANGEIRRERRSRCN